MGLLGEIGAALLTGFAEGTAASIYKEELNRKLDDLIPYVQEGLDNGYITRDYVFQYFGQKAREAEPKKRTLPRASVEKLTFSRKYDGRRWLEEHSFHCISSQGYYNSTWENNYGDFIRLEYDEPKGYYHLIVL